MGKQIPVQYEVDLATGTQSGDELCCETMSSRSLKVVKQRPGAVGQRISPPVENLDKMTLRSHSWVLCYERSQSFSSRNYFSS